MKMWNDRIHRIFFKNFDEFSRLKIRIERRTKQVETLENLILRMSEDQKRVNEISGEFRSSERIPLVQLAIVSTT